VSIKPGQVHVDKKDRWKHSKWLSMMEKRLLLAKRLLKPDIGVLIVTIDEHEVHHLAMLLERVFRDPDYLRHMVTIVINPKGTGKYNFARVDEYAFFCVPNTGESVITGEPTVQAGPTEAAGGVDDAGDEEGDEEEDDEDEEDEGADDEDVEESAEDLPFPIEELAYWELRHARRRGSESSYRHQRPNQFYPIYIDEEKNRVARIGRAPTSVTSAPNMRRVDGLRPIWPIDAEGNHRCWRFIPESMEKVLAEGRLRVGKYNPELESWTLNIWERRPLSKKLKTVWRETLHDAGTHGTTLLYSLLGRRGLFPFAKSLYAVRDTIAAVVRNRPNALILDFFAGSGTTLHATALLNRQDNGSRRCIMVTNNEVQHKVAGRLNKRGVFRGDKQFEAHGIFEQATAPRCKAAVTGRRPDRKPIKGVYPDGRAMSDGFDENVAFFRLDYVDPDDVELGAAFDSIHPLLWLAAGGKGTMPKAVPAGTHAVIRPECGYGVLLRQGRFRDFQKKVVASSDITHVFLVTDSEEAFAEMSDGLPAHLKKTMLYRDYLRTFRINVERYR
jgi:adenine-specific DNA-methyltransferase